MLHQVKHMLLPVFLSTFTIGKYLAGRNRFLK